MIVEAIKGYRAADLPKDAVTGPGYRRTFHPHCYGLCGGGGAAGICAWTSIVAAAGLRAAHPARGGVVFGMGFGRRPP